VTVALFWRKVTLEEALEAVKAELESPEVRRRPPVEIIQLSRLLQSEVPAASFVAGAPPPGAQEMVDGFSEPAGILDSGGRMQVVNAPLAALLGEGRALGRTLLEATRSGELFEAAQRAIAGWPVKAEFNLPSPQKQVHVTLSPLSSSRALLVLRDLTESKRLEGVRRDFIANASHELRTPVTAISGAAETLLTGSLQLDDGVRGFVEIIARHADRLSRLTHDLLDLSRLESGDFRPELGPLDVAPVCETCLDLVRDKADARQIVLGFDGPPELRAVADRRALEQILVNLLDNAVKYTPPGGRVTVLADGGSQSVVLSVIDTGPGIEPRLQQRVFERFYRADNGRARAAGGTGLGLAIVKHLAQAQGGQVGVESGQGGSRFWVRLPAAPQLP
jgi:two-component system phosphate regulon sensor histidine kinase PhoR